MIRRIPVACLALVVTAAAGCTTFSNNDAVAKVGDQTLTRDELARFIPDDGGAAANGPPASASNDGVVAGDAARAEIELWVLGRLISGDLDASGTSVTDADRRVAERALAESPDFTAASDEGKQMFIDAQAAYLAWAARDLQPRYEAGVDESGVVCAAHVLVASERAARDVIEALDGGASFAEVAAERSTDTQSAQNGGALGCVPRNDFQQQFIPEFVDAALQAEIGVPTEPVRSDFGWHVIQLQPYDEVAAALPQFAAQLGVDLDANLSTLIDDAEVYIDPRFGTFTSDGVGALATTTTSTAVGTTQPAP